MMAIIDDAKKDSSIQSLCAAVGVKRSTDYARLKSTQAVDTEQVTLLAQTNVIHKEVNSCYGSRRMSAELKRRGYSLASLSNYV